LDNSKKVKKDQLGMDPGTASNRLKKELMYHFSVKLGMNWCFQCAAKIESSKEMSVEHKTPWLHSEDPVGLFFDIENIAFSHHSCNSRASRGSSPRKLCPSPASYRRGCRCEGCKKSNSDYRKGLRD
tara:strand:+ start:124 stop:504 length:381 start_codon:yes stop_codon:yes gene_type:complete